jgi:PPP family 3-phenylpropionic acid transporter
MNQIPPDLPPDKGRFGFAVRLSLFYGAIFLLIGFHLPYFPVWLDWRGLSPGEIGIILSSPLAVRVIVTPAISFAADRVGNHRLVLIMLAWGALSGLLMFTFARGFWSILSVAILAAMFWTSIMPLTEAVAMDGVRRSGHDYGRMRLWGSLTFIAASFGGGVWLQYLGAPAVLWLMISAAACIVIAAHLLPRPVGKGRLKAATAAPKIRVRDAVSLIRSPLFLLFLFATGLTQSTHAVYYAFGTLHWQSLGISAGVIGSLWAVGVIAEILLFMYSGRVLAAVGTVNFIWLAALAAIVRWTITAFDPPLWVLFPVQILHALTFGAAHLGAVHFISQAIPDEVSGTAQGLYAAFAAGIVMGAALLVSGPLYGMLGKYAYLVMAGVALISLAGSVLLSRKWRGERLITVG